MTTPTQAQIEAAAEAIRKQHYKGIVNFIDLATAALTAAAEVDPAMRAFVADTPYSEPNDGWAVEAGEKPFGAGYTKGYSDGIKYATKDTIERCAKVAEFYGEMNGTHTTIAAAIRALKDRP